jgi:hypothetical protein
LSDATSITIAYVVGLLSGVALRIAAGRVRTLLAEIRGVNVDVVVVEREVGL